MEEAEIKTVRVDLTHHFKYQDKARQSAEAQFITMIAFSMKHMDKVAPVEEIVMRSMGRLSERQDITAEQLEEAKGKAEDDVTDDDKAQLIPLIAMYCDPGDLQKLYAHMKVLLSSCGLASIDDDVSLDGNWITKLSPADFKKLCGAYIGNFIT